MHAPAKVPARVLFWGGTGQCKVMRGVAEHHGARLVAVFDNKEGTPPPFPDVPLFHESRFDEWLAGQQRQGLGFAVTIGNPHGRARLAIHQRLQVAGLVPATLIHPTAWISPRATIGDGAQIHAGAVIETEAVLGRQCIINTKASIDHECRLADGVEVAPGATLCGIVAVGTAAWICAGATVLPRVTIGDDAVVGAGALVRLDVPPGTTVVGVPARPVASRPPKGSR